MTSSNLPLEIKTFLNEMIESVSHLEVLLLLYTTPEKLWNAKLVSEELRSNLVFAQNQLDFLTKKGLLIKDTDNFYHYRNLNTDIHDSIETLQRLYIERPVSIISLILENKQNALKNLSDAFKF